MPISERNVYRPSKEAKVEGRNSLYVEESACYLLPFVAHIWAPHGQTPLLLEQAGRAYLSLIAAISPIGRLHLPTRETPYLNGDKRLVRWKFVEFLGYDNLPIYKDWEEHVQQGIEVASAFFNKRWQLQDYWDGSDDTPSDKA